MSVELHWRLFTGDEGRRLPAHGPQHWIDVARAAEYAGFQALHVPSGPDRPDAWLVAAALARSTRQLRFVVALRPGFVLPPAAAQAAQTLDELSQQRVALGLIVGGDSAQHRIYGDPVNHDDRFARAAEFIHLVKQCWRGRGGSLGFNHRGAHYRVENAGLLQPLRAPLRLYVGGSGPSTEAIAAAHADVFVLGAEAPQALAGRIERLRALAAAQERTLQFACRLHLIAAETEAEAWRLADAAVQAAWRGPGAAPPASEFGETRGQARGFWRGVGLLRGRMLGAQPRWEDGAGLVGSYRDVAERLQQLHALGIRAFVLSGEQGLEDTLRYGEELLPLLRAAPARAEAPGTVAAPLRIQAPSP